MEPDTILRPLQPVEQEEEYETMRLLLAEDEKALSRALTAILERHSYSVDAVFDGQEALEYLETDNYVSI